MSLIELGLDLENLSLIYYMSLIGYKLGLGTFMTFIVGLGTQVYGC